MAYPPMYRTNDLMEREAEVDKSTNYATSRHGGDTPMEEHEPQRSTSVFDPQGLEIVLNSLFLLMKSENSIRSMSPIGCRHRLEIGGKEEKQRTRGIKWGHRNPIIRLKRTTLRALAGRSSWMTMMKVFHSPRN